MVHLKPETLNLTTGLTVTSVCMKCCLGTKEVCGVMRGGPRDAKAVVTDAGEGCGGQRNMTSLTLSYDRMSVIFWIGSPSKIFIVCVVPRVHVGLHGLCHNQERAGVSGPC